MNDLPGHILDKIHKASLEELDYFNFCTEIHRTLDAAGYDPCKYADKIEVWTRKLYNLGVSVERATLTVMRIINIYII